MGLSVYLKEFYGSVKSVLTDSNGIEVFELAEDNGTPKSSLYGTDSGGNLDALRTNASQQLQVEVVNNIVQVDSVILTASLAAIFNPGTDATEQYEVYVQFTNYTSAAATVDLAIDIGGGTTADRFCLNDYTVAANDISRWFGPIGINGDDDIIALASATTTIVAHLKVIQIV